MCKFRSETLFSLLMERVLVDLNAPSPKRGVSHLEESKRATVIHGPLKTHPRDETMSRSYKAVPHKVVADLYRVWILNFAPLAQCCQLLLTRGGIVVFTDGYEC